MESSNEIFLEEEVKGELLSVESIVANQKCHILGIISRSRLKSNEVVEMGFGFPYHPANENKIKGFIKQVHELFNIKFGITHIELIIDAKMDVIELVDLNPRLCGNDLLMVLNGAFETTMQDHLIDFACGKDIVDDIAEPSKYAYLQMIMPPPGIKELKSISIPDNQDIFYSKQLKPIGHKFLTTINQLDYIYSIVTQGVSMHDSRKKAHLIAEQIIVNDNQKAVYT